MAFQKKLGAGIFGDEGFVLQKLSGNADAWIELDGEVMIYDLQPGQVLRVHPGHVGMFQESVQLEITTVGIKNKLFGGDGLFPVKLTRPGRVWLQTLPLANLAHALSPYMVEGETASGGNAGAVAGCAGRPPRRRLDSSCRPSLTAGAAPPVPSRVGALVPARPDVSRTVACRVPGRARA